MLEKDIQVGVLVSTIKGVYELSNNLELDVNSVWFRQIHRESKVHTFLILDIIQGHRPWNIVKVLSVEFQDVWWINQTWLEPMFQVFETPPSSALWR